FSGFFSADHPARDTVCLAATVKLLESWYLCQFSRYHELAADLDEDAVLFGEAPHRGGTGCAQLGLETARLVVQARVNDAGVAASLVLRDARLLLQHRDRVPAPDQLGSGGQPDDSCAGDNDVTPHWSMSTRACAESLGFCHRLLARR